MKKICIIVIFLFGVKILYAKNHHRIAKLTDSVNVDTTQSKNIATDNKQLVRTAADLKSGTSQDVLSSFFKLAYTDLSDGHHFQFSSSLFAVRAKTDTDLWIDGNYRKQVFARNFVFGIDYGLDSNYKFKSASFNVKYAIINNRDKDLFNTPYGEKLYHFMDVSSKLFAQAENIYFF